jgi:ferritin-like metal-binding protein YciE
MPNTHTHPLQQLMVDELRDLYHAEKQLTRALPKLAKNVASPELRELLETHLEETEHQITRLETAFEKLGERPRGKHCDGMAGIVEEGNALLQEDFEDAVMDAGIIAGAQRAEHYEIAAYGSVMAWAKALGHKDIAALLDETLEEEKAADKKLSALAERSVNRQALNGGNGAATERASERSTGKQAAGTGRR